MHSGKGLSPQWSRRGQRIRKMKLIIAYIQPERLNAVKQALFAREIYKVPVTNALCCGQQDAYASFQFLGNT